MCGCGQCFTRIVGKRSCGFLRVSNGESIDMRHIGHEYMQFGVRAAVLALIPACKADLIGAPSALHEKAACMIDMMKPETIDPTIQSSSQSPLSRIPRERADSPGTQLQRGTARLTSFLVFNKSNTSDVIPMGGGPHGPRDSRNPGGHGIIPGPGPGLPGAIPGQTRCRKSRSAKQYKNSACEEND